MKTSLFLAIILVSSIAFSNGEETKKPLRGLCSLCEGLIEQVDEALKHGDDIEKAVENFCKNDVPGFLVEYCEKIVSNNLKFIIEKLKDHASAEEICTTIHLC